MLRPAGGGFDGELDGRLRAGEPAPGAGEGSRSVQTFLAAGPSALAVAARLDRLALRAVAFSASTAIVATNFKVSMS